MEDVEARFAHLLQPIRDLTKNWEVDVAAQLGEYLEEVSGARGSGAGRAGGAARRGGGPGAAGRPRPASSSAVPALWPRSRSRSGWGWWLSFRAAPPRPRN